MYGVMLDTCIWIDFVLIEWKKNFNEKINKYLQKSEKLEKLWMDGKFLSMTSKWNLWEFTDQLDKLMLQRKFILHGYSPIEFSEAKKI